VGAGESVREVRRGSRVVRLSSATRILWPEEGITKGDLFDYYQAVAPALLPHLRNRPFTMKRYREGVAGGHFFQKDAPAGMPEWIPRRAFRTHPREGGTRIVQFPLVNDELGLAWMVQMHCIDMNAWYSRIDKPERPDFVLFDLDPPDGGFTLAVRVAHLIRELLADVGLESYAKTSGADGVHVLAPITRRSSYEQTRSFSERAAAVLERRHPELVTTQWRKAKRRGVYLDARQNGPGRTIASVYSVRPKAGAPVSTPVRWEELTESLDPRAYTMAAVLRRLERYGELFEPVLAAPQSLAPAARLLAALTRSERT